jgi:N-acetylglucosamine-6-phosphate deacetylase
MKITARHYRTGELVDVEMADARISAIRPSSLGAGEAGVELPYVAPGMIDVQVNGFGGAGDFDEDGDREAKWRGAATKLLAHGVTMFLPTFCTNSRQGFTSSLSEYRELIESDPMLAHVMPGVHIEGPYISDEDGPRGAHSLEHTRDPDMAEIEEWIAACGGRLRVFTLAPERQGSVEVIRELSQRGVAVSIAHTAATTEQLDAAVRAGAKFSTHLGNGSHVTINRHRNYIYDQLADDRLWASVIPDGHHVPSALFRIMMRAKGLQRVVLTSDSVGLAGLPPGVYNDGRQRITEDGKIELVAQPGILSGSWISLDVGVGRAVEMAGMPLAEAIDLCTVQPARLLNLADRGRLEEGAIADLILFDWDSDSCKMEVVDTILQGESTHKTKR